MAEYLTTAVLTATASPAVLGGAAGAVLVIVAGIVAAARRRQRAAIGRLEERVAQLAAGVSLLTNTTEDGLRTVAMEIARLSGASDTGRPQGPLTVRQRVASAAGHGRSVQDIAASEQLSEGEVLLHLLLDKLKPETARADA